MSEIIIICGPTGSGKSAIAHKLAKNIGGEIINADSMQMYDGLRILTASPTFELTTELPYHLYNFLPLDASYDLAKYVTLAAKTAKSIIDQGKRVIIVGGTGMYINAIIEGYSKIPEVSSENQKKIRELQQKLGQEEFYKLALTMDPLITKIHPSDSQRTSRAVKVFLQTGKSINVFNKIKTIDPFKGYSKRIIYLNPERELLRTICQLRLAEMFENGIILEVEKVIAKYGSDVKCKVIGFREIIEYLTGSLEYEGVFELVKSKTLQYAKRQRTWFNHQIKEKEEYNYSNIEEFQKICYNIVN